MEQSLGLVAGKVLTYLNENRAASLTHLSADIRCPFQRLKEVVGILERGGLIQISEQNREEIVSKMNGKSG